MENETPPSVSTNVSTIPSPAGFDLNDTSNLQQILGVSLPMPAGVEVVNDMVTFPSDYDVDLLITYINLNWSLFQMNGAIEYDIYGTSSSRFGDKQTTWFQHLGTFANDSAEMLITVEKISVTNDPDAKSTMVFQPFTAGHFSEAGQASPSVPMIHLLDTEPENIDWSKLPLPDGRQDADSFNPELSIQPSQLTGVDLVEFFNSEWPAAGIQGEFDAEPGTASWTINDGTFEATIYSGYFSDDTYRFNIQVTEDETGSYEPVSISADYKDSSLALSDLPLTKLIETDSWFDEMTFLTELSPTDLLDDINGSWPMNGLNGLISTEPSGIFFSQVDEMVHVHYDGRFEYENTVYLVRIFDGDESMPTQGQIVELPRLVADYYYPHFGR